MMISIFLKYAKKNAASLHIFTFTYLVLIRAVKKAENTNLNFILNLKGIISVRGRRSKTVFNCLLKAMK